MVTRPAERPPGPIFLAGLDRSGIGLLGEILESHPDVSMTRRTNFWSYYAGRFGPLLEASSVDRCLAALATDRRMRLFDPDVSRLHRDLFTAEPTYARLFECLQIQLMERRGSSIWGDKSLEAERYADEVLTVYPDARIVHILRDPRGRFASLKWHRGLARGGLGAAIAKWRSSERLGRRNERRFMDRYLVIRYEDLVGDSGATLERVRVFLHLRLAQSEDFAAVPFRLDSVGRHERDVSALERQSIETALRATMKRWGYATTGRALSTTDRIRFWGRFAPGCLVQGAVWTAMDTARRRRGLRPSPERQIEVT